MGELQGTSELPEIIYEIICTYRYMNFFWGVGILSVRYSKNP